ncbi:MAG: CoA transferase, partial [Dehalococcoidia bacterium]|nr:CoA transferase [Dehalococcoidia bacterium]
GAATLTDAVDITETLSALVILPAFFSEAVGITETLVRELVLAIGITDADNEWEQFCRVMGSPQWIDDPRFATPLARKQNESELDRLIEEKTKKIYSRELMEKLQSAGIAAGVLHNAQGVHEDPQLEFRHHFWLLDHPVIGKHSYDGPAFRLSKTPVMLNKAAPCLGEDNEYVCTKILGLSDEELVDLYTQGALE